MWSDIPIYTTNKYLVLQLGLSSPTNWYEVTVIADGDKRCRRVYGLEVFLNEEAELSIEALAEQFRDVDNIVMEAKYGLMYIKIRKERNTDPGFGFGREAYVGLDEAGYLSIVCVPWNAPGAGTPTADPEEALSGLPHRIWSGVLPQV